MNEWLNEWMNEWTNCTTNKDFSERYSGDQRLGSVTRMMFCLNVEKIYTNQQYSLLEVFNNIATTY